MVETRIQKNTDPLIQAIDTEDFPQESPRSHLKKSGQASGKLKDEVFHIRVDLSDRNKNYYDGMDPYAGLKQKLRPHQ